MIFSISSTHSSLMSHHNQLHCIRLLKVKDQHFASQLLPSCPCCIQIYNILWKWSIWQKAETYALSFGGSTVLKTTVRFASRRTIDKVSLLRTGSTLQRFSVPAQSILASVHWISVFTFSYSNTFCVILFVLLWISHFFSPLLHSRRDCRTSGAKHTFFAASPFHFGLLLGHLTSPVSPYHISSGSSFLQISGEIVLGFWTLNNISS